ncbi:GlxA family transcriptional regulator [Xinfangfangia sp. CPCC 101601]|uniref:GlxA family transcriptional regulator n=1 Tax=Pseudogemmobacter lacusdianii TaxID=3069608 RepID=A0ABU0W2Y0_9RHOB|nr:GlxA family transcriptional regulator [Xinfangfangia sp. CPCC 101601]MDQ2067810.1 GlxA family transcriptional regulator [Xinfangfangia sp. CPCC 101601]
MKHMVPTSAQSVPIDGQTKLRRYVFLALSSFSAFDLTAAIEALKDANRLHGRNVYAWRILSVDGSGVTSSSGLRIDVDGGLEQLNRDDTLVVLNGDDFIANATTRVLTWLGVQSRRVGRLGAISSGVYTVLKARAIRPAQVAVHWTYRSGLQEAFSDIQIDRSVFNVSGTTFTCSGGLGTVDVMLHLIREDHGLDLATSVSDSLICSTPRTMAHEQTFSQMTRVGDRNWIVASAIELMQDKIEYPIPPSEIARKIGVSTRQLERLFSRHMNSTPKTYYMRLRMEQARNLLLQTNMQVIEVSVATGFNTPSHFSKIYRKHFGNSPHRERGFSATGLAPISVAKAA